MEVTYLNHSGFLLAFEKSCLIFDYYKGTIPDLSQYETIFVFVSHWHQDHYNDDIFLLNKKYANVFYILEHSVRISEEKKELTNLKNNQLIFIKENESCEIDDQNGNALKIKTLHSTDIGVAFYIDYLGKVIYHAGDLNLWVWKEESQQYNDKMRRDFSEQMERLKGQHMDVAFAPLDPRQEEDYADGLKLLLETAHVDKVFPMHFWNQPEVIDHFISEYGKDYPDTTIMQLKYDGDSCTI